MDKIDESWMLQALNEATKGGWQVHPNPMVGAVIVKDGAEIGRGYHRGVGHPHAEVEALKNARENGHDVAGATIYVTLEPCNHFGHTPPCSEALIQSGIARCVMGSLDPNRKVKGGGLQRLLDAGISCQVGVCQKELIQLNAPFFTRTRFNRPYITAKWAMTADGKITSKSGDSKWITGINARHDVHIQRSLHDAIIAGTQTILADNPQLNVRIQDNVCRQPVRIILDRNLRIPLDFHVFNTQNQRTILFTKERDTDWQPYTDRGIELEFVPENISHTGLELTAVLFRLADKYSFTTLYCEGGSALHGTLHDLGYIDQIHVYIAPKIIGGNNALPPLAGSGIEFMSDATQFIWQPPIVLGEDIRLTAQKPVIFDSHTDGADT